MLTNGWRKFDWGKLKSGFIPILKYPKESNYMTLNGEITNFLKNKFPKNLLLNIAIQAKDSSRQLLFIPVMQAGKFEDKTVFFYDSSILYYSLNDNLKLKSNSKLLFKMGY